MNPIDLIVLALACWRLSNLFANEDGPFHCFRHMRQFAKRLTRRNWWCRFFGLSTLATCEYCNSVYICSAITILYFFFHECAVWAMLPFAGSAAVIFLKHLHEKPN